MKVLLVLLAAAAFVLSTEALTQWNGKNFNRTQWNGGNFNRTVPALNRTHGNGWNLNRTQWNGGNFNRTVPALNRTHGNGWNLNRTQWNGGNFNRTVPALNRTHGNGWNLNRTQWNGGNFNRTHGNGWNLNRTQWIAENFNRTQPKGNNTRWNRTNHFYRHPRSVQWNGEEFNKTRWIQELNAQNLNRTQQQQKWSDHGLWNGQEFNKTRWMEEALERIQSNGTSNRTQWIDKWNGQKFNRDQWPGENNDTRREGHRHPRSPAWNNTWSRVNQTTHNGDVIIGNIGYLDRLLFNQTYLKESRWWSSREKIIEYPKDLPGKYSSNRPETITAIRIYNKFYSGLESKAKVLAGGVGFRYVKIELSSPWNRGFKYLVQIFGH